MECGDAMLCQNTYAYIGKRQGVPRWLHFSGGLRSAPGCGVFVAAPGVWQVLPPAAAVSKEFKLIVSAAMRPV